MRKLELDVEYQPLTTQARQRVRLATAKLIIILWRRENSQLDVERSSVYGAAFVIPQVARSSGWPKELTQLVVRSYFLLFLTIFLQGFMVMLLCQEEAVMDRFSGQMSLCDFGVTMGHCPDGPGCTGPGGTLYEPSRLYSWNAWVLRNFVKQALLDVFPEHAHTTNAQVDPGEYGLESQFCRYLCIFLFVISLMGEAEGIRCLWRLIYHLPNTAGTWLHYEVPDWDEDKHKAKALRGYTELDLVKLQVAGMPVMWKVINGLVLLLPKCLVWYWTANAGVTFLMETASINSTIINSTALAFILNIDELLFNCATTDAIKHIVSSMDGKYLYDQDEEENMPDDNVIKAHAEAQLKPCLHDCLHIIPMKLVGAVAVAAYGIIAYYNGHCVTDPSGVFVSKDMFLPKTVNYGPFEAFLPFFFGEDVEAKPYWTMPSTPSP